jgi:hypothetical protein
MHWHEVAKSSLTPAAPQLRGGHGSTRSGTAGECRSNEWAPAQQRRSKPRLIPAVLDRAAPLIATNNYWPPLAAHSDEAAANVDAYCDRFF